MLDTFNLNLDIETQTFFLRLLNSIVIFLGAIELFRSQHLLKNERVTRLVYKAAVLLLSFFLLRVISTFADSYLGGNIGWFSNAANVIFWGYIYTRCRSLRVTLQSGISVDRRTKISETLEELLVEMEAAKKNLRKLPRQDINAI